MNETEDKILRAVAEAQQRKQPFESEIDGVDYKDIREKFTNEDFNGVNPTARLGLALDRISEKGYLNRVFEASNSPNRYRLSEQGRNYLDSSP